MTNKQFVLEHSPHTVLNIVPKKYVLVVGNTVITGTHEEEAWYKARLQIEQDKRLQEGEL